MTVYCATSNPGKLREFQLAAPDFDVRALPSKVEPPEEHGSTFEENAVAKAEYYGAFVNGYLFADDSGLEVDALNGAPGVHSARYAGEQATDKRNNALLLERLKHSEKRTARFVCVIALVKNAKLLRTRRQNGVRRQSLFLPGGGRRPLCRLVKTFRGSVEGRILDGERGSGGFGYDPLFYYEPFRCTFGEAAIEDKMKVSHRAQALDAMFTFLRNTASI